MCHFITATVPSDTNQTHLNGLLEAFDLAFRPVKNGFIERQLPRNVVYGTLTMAMCDCGTPLGSLEDPVPVFEVGKHKIKKLRRRNWSEKRIEAWIEEKRAAHEKTRAAADQFRLESVSLWQEVIIAVVENNAAASIGLLKHWYSDGVQSERFALSIQHVPTRQVTPEYLSRISEDILYVFSALGKSA